MIGAGVLHRGSPGQRQRVLGENVSMSILPWSCRWCEKQPCSLRSRDEIEPSEMFVCAVCEYTGVWSTCTCVGYMSVCEERGVPEYMGVCLQKLEVYVRYTPSFLPPPFFFF